MTTRVPAHHYTMRPSPSFISAGAAAAAAAAEIDGISDAVTEDSLDNDDESTVDCIHEYRGGGMPMHGGGVDDDDGGMIGNSAMSSGPSYHILTANDVSPIETARARFLQIVVDHFVNEHVVEVASSPDDDYANNEHDKLNKRKPREANYEGDPRFVLPLMYVANLYETLVNDVNMRLASLDGIREKTIGVALEAAGGLYRKLAKKFPRRGQCSFKRRELATSIETRTRFPELVVQEEKRIRFVVVNGLVIVEKPNLTVEDAEWFKRLTGRHEVAISARDYKFYTPRHKYRRCTAQSVSNIPGLGTFSGSDSSSPLASATGFRPVNEPPNQQQSPSKHQMQQLSPQPQFHSLHQAHHQTIQQNQHATPFSHMHQCSHTSTMSDIAHQHQSLAMPQHMACLQCLSGVHVGGRLHILPTSLAKFCDECGVPYLRETSKFCSECGTKRLGTL